MQKITKKVGEYLITTSFQVQLESAGQWDRCVVELDINLKMIVGEQGITLSYLIRENNTSDHTERDTKGWEVCIQWKYGSSTWNQVKDVKESFLVQLA